MPSWWEELMQGRAVPSAAPSPDAKPTSPVAPFPTIPLTAIRDNRWERRYRRQLKTGIQPAVLEYLQAVLGVVPIGQFNAEDYFPEEQLFFGGVVIPQNAAKRSIAQIGPTIAGAAPQPGFIMVVEYFQALRLNTAGEIDLFWDPTPVSNVGIVTNNAVTRDERLGVGSGTSFGPVVVGNNGFAAHAVPAAFVPVFSGAGVNPAVVPPFVMSGDGAGAVNVLTIQPTIDNEGIAVMCAVRVRQAPPAN